MFSTAAGVACCPRTAVATSPGRISVATKMTTEAAHAVTRPRASRRAISLARLDKGPILFEPDLFRDPEPGQHRRLDEAVEVLLGPIQVVVEHRDDFAAILPDHALELGVHLLALVDVEGAPRFFEKLI